jgi:hypothetical protein
MSGILALFRQQRVQPVFRVGGPGRNLDAEGRQPWAADGDEQGRNRLDAAGQVA